MKKMKIWITGNRQREVFPSLREINPAEIEMRPDDRTKSKNSEGGQLKARRWVEGCCWKSRNMSQPVETALSALWPESNISLPRVLLLRLTKGNVIKLGFVD